VALNPKTHIIATVGAIDGLSTLTQVLLNPGDVLAVPDPYYPPYVALAKVAGAELLPLPSPASTGFLPDLDRIPASTWQRTKVLLLNYPNNPTGALATREFYERILALAQKFNFLIVNDFAYAGLNAPDGSKPLSLLNVAKSLGPSAQDVALEVVSLSKMYAMAGWRLGFVAAPEAVMATVRDYHHQMRSFPTGSVQDAGAVALASDQSSVRAISEVYQARRAVLSEGLRGAGLDVFDTHGALFVWAGIPAGFDADEFAAALLDATGVAVMPGTCFGEGGRGYVRLSLLDSEANLRRAAERIASSERLHDLLARGE
jgi:aminotransferase